MEKETRYVDINYVIEFFSNWHCGSGLAAGADVDALVVKDKAGLPYVPGRTLKGLLREAAEDLYDDESSKAAIGETFGVSGDNEHHKAGCAFFGNASFPENEAVMIVDKANDYAKYLYQTFASTAIDEDGIAADNTLRKIETVVSCRLQGVILNVPENAVGILTSAAKMIKRMGTGRNRGYGRCKIEITGKEDRNDNDEI